MAQKNSFGVGRRLLRTLQRFESFLPEKQNKRRRDGVLTSLPPHICEIRFLTSIYSHGGAKICALVWEYCIDDPPLFDDIV